MVLYFLCISCVKLWAEPFRNFPLNCTLGCVRCVDRLYVMPHPHLLGTASVNLPLVTERVSSQFAI